jgi:hypothetical protein
MPRPGVSVGHSVTCSGCCVAVVQAQIRRPPYLHPSRTGHDLLLPPTCSRELPRSLALVLPKTATRQTVKLEQRASNPHSISGNSRAPCQLGYTPMVRKLASIASICTIRQLRTMDSDHDFWVQSPAFCRLNYSAVRSARVELALKGS